MGAHLDLNDVVADHPLAKQELDDLRCQIEDLEWENKGIEEWREVAVTAIAKAKELRERAERAEADYARLRTLMDVAEVVILRQRTERINLRSLLRQLRGWDVLHSSHDGKYWREEIDAALAGEKP